MAAQRVGQSANWPQQPLEQYDRREGGVPNRLKKVKEFENDVDDSIHSTRVLSIILRGRFSTVIVHLGRDRWGEGRKDPDA